LTALARPAAAVSAHRGGCEDASAGTYEAFRAAARAGADYIEFDIRRTADAQLVVYHDATLDGGRAVRNTSYAALCGLAGYEVPLAAEVMGIIAGRAIGHLDLKEPGDEEVIIEQALEILGAGNFVATTLEDVSVAAISKRFPDVPVALSLGRDFATASWRQRLAMREDLYPLRRVRACGADWVAMHRHGIKTMVWTVNGDAMLARWLADPCVNVVVTDTPRRALALREKLSRGVQ
jgi:glycerophosphoryl diester phosphodiesterase